MRPRYGAGRIFGSILPGARNVGIGRNRRFGEPGKSLSDRAPPLRMVRNISKNSFGSQLGVAPDDGHPPSAKSCPNPAVPARRSATIRQSCADDVLRRQAQEREGGVE